MNETQDMITESNTLTAETSPVDTPANPHNAEIVAMRVHQHGETEAGLITRIELHMHMTGPRLTESGESSRLIREAARAELEKTGEFVEFVRLRDRVAEMERQRSAAASVQAKCESELPEIITRGDDPTDCEKRLSKAKAEVGTLTDRLRILRQAEADAHRKCATAAARIVQSVDLRYRQEAVDARDAAFLEFASCRQLLDLCHAQTRQRDAHVSNDRNIVEQIVPPLSSKPAYGVHGAAAVVTRVDLGNDAFKTLQREQVGVPMGARPGRHPERSEATMVANVRGEPTDDPAPPPSEHMGGRAPMTIVRGGMGAPQTSQN